MKTSRHVLCCLPIALLCACSGSNPSTQSTGSTAGSVPAQDQISSALKQASRKAHEGLVKENLKLSGGPAAAPAEITPAGDFLVNGQAVQLDAHQRELVTRYRADLLEVASAGIDLGIQGADLGVRAAKEAVIGALSGKGDEIKQRLEAEADKIKVSAAQLCAHLPGLRSSQEALAAALPAFAPYAQVDQVDVDGCEREITSNVAGGNQPDRSRR